MFSKLTENLSTFIQPLSTLVNINVKAAEKLINAQATFVTSALNEGVAHTQALTAEKDIKSAFATQKAYSKSYQAKVTTAVKDIMQVATETSKEATEVLKGSYKNLATKAQ